jgi:biopolymer transport protein ExbB
MTDHLKILLLRAGMGTTLKQVEVPQAMQPA